MKTFASAALSVILATSDAQSRFTMRNLRGKNGESGMCVWSANKGEALLARIEETCGEFSCDNVVADDLKCDSWETAGDETLITLVGELCNEDLTDDEKEAIRQEVADAREENHDKFMNMTAEEREAFSAEVEAARENNAATVFGCACCSVEGIASISDLIEGKEGLVAKQLGFAKSGRPMGKHEGQMGAGFGGGSRPGPSGYGGNRKTRRNPDSGTLEDIINSECPLFDCTGVDEDISCPPERPSMDEFPSRDELQNMNDEEKEEWKAAMEATREEHHENMLKCACCTDTSIDELMSGESGKGFGDGSRPAGAGAGSIVDGGSRPGPGGRGGSRKMLGRPDSGTLEDLMTEECPAFDCDGVDEAVFCPPERPSMDEFPSREELQNMTDEEKEEWMAAMDVAREEHHQNMLGCVCCRDMSIDELMSGESGEGFGNGPRPAGAGAGAGFDEGARPGPGGRGGARKTRGNPNSGKLEDMINDECPAFDCDGVDGDVSCPPERPSMDEFPSREELQNMDDEEKEEWKAAMDDAREEHRQNILGCTCCTDMSIEDLTGGGSGTGFGERPSIGGSRPGSRGGTRLIRGRA